MGKGLTPGQHLLLQQIQLVAIARNWDVPKTLKKVRDTMAILEESFNAKLKWEEAQKAKKEQEKTPRKPPTPEEQALIDQAEAILKSLQKPSDAKGDNKAEGEVQGLEGSQP